MAMVVTAASVALAMASAVLAQDVLVRLAGDQLQVSAPNFHFISGKPLESMKNGVAIPFDIQVSVLSDGKMTVLRRSFERFVISYDVWEERFSVALMRSNRSSVSHLGANAAESWCLNRFSVQAAGLPADKPFWVRIDVRAQNGRDQRDNGSEEGFSLSTLIDMFSRPPRQHLESQWRAESGPVRLADLGRTVIR
jgi:hypothetical protein